MWMHSNSAGYLLAAHLTRAACICNSNRQPTGRAPGAPPAIAALTTIPTIQLLRDSGRNARRQSQRA